METKQIFEDLSSHLDDEDIIERDYFNTEIARFKNLMIQHTDVSNEIIAEDLIGSLINFYYHLDEQIKENKELGSIYKPAKNAYDLAASDLIMICKSLNIELTKSFIADMKNRGDYIFTSLMESCTPLEQERGKVNKSKKMGSPGRPRKANFDDCIIVANKKGLKAKLKELIGNKTAKDACPFIKAAIKARVITKPSARQIEELCPSVKRTPYDRQMGKNDAGDAINRLVKHFVSYQ
jgi:hypothetical protein